MCPSRLPSEVTSYRPSGMLDRDQRTTFTIHRIRDGPSSIVIPTATAAAAAAAVATTSSSTTNSLNNRPYLSHHNQQCNNNCENSMNTCMASQAKDLFGRADTNCKCDCQQQKNNNLTAGLWEDSNMASIRLTRKYKPTSGYCRSRTKFFNYLLVFICIWLASIHHTCAYPFPRAAMSAEINQDSNSQRCRAIVDAIKKPKDQAGLTSQYIGALLNEYTQAQFKKQPSEVHEEWKAHPAHFRYNPEMEKYQADKFDGNLSEKFYEHLNGKGAPSQDLLIQEFHKIYHYFHILRKVLIQIIEDRKANASQIMHHLNNNRRENDIINHLFAEQLRYNKLDITEIETAMTALQIPHPAIPELAIEAKDRIIAEWISTREYIKVLTYVIEVYKAIERRCKN